MRLVTLLALAVLSGPVLAPAEPKPTLLELAKKEFAPRQLTEAEQVLFLATEKGQAASMLTGKDQHDDPGNAGTWPEGRTIKAESLVWLCTNREASAIVTHRGVQIHGMCIDGAVDLSDAKMSFPLVARNCAFAGDILLKNSRMRSLSLPACSARNLRADGTQIEGDVSFVDGFKAEGELSFLEATIGGNLDCEGAQLTKTDSRALIADSAKISGSVFLRYGFRAQGEVNLLGATIGGSLDCDGAKLTNPDGKALFADRAEIAGNVFLRKDPRQDRQNSFTAQGEINLLGATINGNLECDGAQFTNPDGRVLFAFGTKINRNVLLGGSRPDGRVDFYGSDVGGGFFWEEVSSTEKTVLDLRSAKVGSLHVDKTSWLAAGEMLLDGFVYDRLFVPAEEVERIQWLLKPQSHDEFSPQPYEHLASVLRNMGHDGEARAVMIAKNQDHARFTRKFSQEWWWYNVFGRSIGYGYQPWNAFWGSLILIVLGWFLFRKGYLHDLISPSDEKGYAKNATGEIVLKNGRHTFSKEYTSFNSFVYSLESFTPLLKLDQSSKWTPNANRGRRLRIWRLHCTTGSLLRVYLWLHIMAGWVLTSLWVGGVTGLVKS